MKKLFFLIGIMLVASSSFAQVSSTRISRLKIQEEDGSPVGRFHTLKVTDGQMIDNGDGTASLSISGGSGGSGSGTVTINGTQASPANFIASTDITWNLSSNTVTAFVVNESHTHIETNVTDLTHTTDTFVTNKDTHNHIGGDGANIDHDTIDGVTTSDHHIQTVDTDTLYSAGLHMTAVGTLFNVDDSLSSYTDDLTHTTDTFVTNKDTHDHVGGDGTQIDHDNLANVSTSDHHILYTDAEVDAIVSTHTAITTAHHTATVDTNTFAKVHDAGVLVSDNTVTLDFDGTDFTMVESPSNDFDISVTDSGIDHDATTNFTSTEHFTEGSISHDSIADVSIDDHHTETHTIVSHDTTGTGANLTELTDASETTLHSHAGGGGAPTDVNYLVGTADATLSAEIVVGTTPGGELGNTWASPTIDSTHSGSAHHTLYTDAEAVSAVVTADDYLVNDANDITSGGITFGTNATAINSDGSAVFNEQGANVDFRIEGDTNSELFVVDGGLDMVGIGTLVPATTLHVRGAITVTGTTLDTNFGSYVDGKVNSVISVYDNAGAQTFTTGTILLNMDVVHLNTDSDIYTLTSDEIDVARSDAYLVMYSVSTEVSTGTSRSAAKCWIEIDSVEKDGTRCWMYNRTAVGGENSCAKTIAIDITAGENVRVRCNRVEGTSTVGTLADGSTLTIMRLAS